MANDGAGGAGAPSQGGGGGTGQGGFSGQGNQGYAPPPVQQQRARVGEFSAFSAQGMPGSGMQPQFAQTPGADGLPGQQIGLQNTQVMDRPQDPNDPFSPLDNGLDAQSQALAFSDEPDPLAPISPDMEQDDSVPAQVITADQLRAELMERRQWMESDDLADPFMSKFVVATVNGQRYRVPVAEAVKGYQRNEDYSTKLREMYAYEQQLQQREAGLQKLLTDMDDGQKFLDAMVFLKKFEGFSKAAIIYGTQLDAERRMTPEQRQVHQAMRAERAYRQQLELEVRSLRAAQQQHQLPSTNQQQTPTSEQVQAIYMKQLAHLAPNAAAKVGFVNTPIAQLEFEKHFNARLPTIAGRDITSEFIEDVMVAAMESVEAHLQRSGFVRPPEQLPASTQPRVPQGVPQGGQWARQQQQLAAQRRQELPPVSAGAGPTQPLNSGNRVQRARIGEFDRGVRGRL